MGSLFIDITVDVATKFPMTLICHIVVQIYVYKVFCTSRSMKTETSTRIVQDVIKLLDFLSINCHAVNYLCDK